MNLEDSTQPILRLFVKLYQLIEYGKWAYTSTEGTGNVKLSQIYPTVIEKVNKEKSNRLFQQIQAERLEKKKKFVPNGNLIPDWKVSPAGSSM